MSGYAQRAALTVSSVDENGTAVAGVMVEFRGPASVRCVTNAAGQCHLTLPAGIYDLTASKSGFYQTILHGEDASRTKELRITLSHTQEVKESVEVTASPPAIDGNQVSEVRSLSNTEIINVPFPVTRDVRQVLPYIPGVVRDRFGQVHVAGTDTYQSLTLLDGFTVSDPATGLLNTRFSTDAVRAIDMESSRYSAQYGPASGGVTAFTSISGDDHFRFSATNFVPSFQFKQGFHFDKVTPRATFSGPIAKGRAWFLIAPDAEYDNNIVSELPAGQNHNPVWRVSNLAKLQVNLSRSNALSASFLVNDLHSAYGGVSPFTPIETTLKEAHSSYLASLRDQILVHGTLIEAGVAVSRFHDRALPLGDAPYIISPGIAHGNFYRSDRASSGRLEPQLNFYLPRFRLGGSHELRFGAGFRRTDAAYSILRTPISILRENGTLFSRIVFSNAPRWNLSQAVYGGWLEDRWSPREKLLVQFGVRADRDTTIGAGSFSPRIAAAYMLAPSTKLSAGIATYHDYPTLGMLGRRLEGPRTQYFYDATGTAFSGTPASVNFVAPTQPLRPSSSRNWSVGIEQQLPHRIFLSADYLDRYTTHDLIYQFQQPAPDTTLFSLSNDRTSLYRGLQLTAHWFFGQDRELFVAYNRSTAHASAVLEYSLDNPVYSAQAAGPLAWDAPNKIVSWGFLPLPHFTKWSFGYSAEWHTGLPFSVFNQFQQLVGRPNSRRFPDYLTINPFLERRFRFKGYTFALRGGFENITGSRNPLVVQNNIDASDFLRFGVTAHRAFTARIRLLGEIGQSQFGRGVSLHSR